MDIKEFKRHSKYVAEQYESIRQLSQEEPFTSFLLALEVQNQTLLRILGQLLDVPVAGEEE